MLFVKPDYFLFLLIQLTAVLDLKCQFAIGLVSEEHVALRGCCNGLGAHEVDLAAFNKGLGRGDRRVVFS